MKYLYAILLLCLLFLPQAHSATWYVTESGAGTNSGTSLANAWSLAQYNASATTTGAGDTVLLSGVITDEVVVPNGGALGNVLTILFASGASVSRPEGTLISCSGINYLTIDGGSNGLLENTDNGTLLTYQVTASGVYANGAGNGITVQNLVIRNLYVRASGDAASPNDLTAGAGVDLQGYTGNCVVRDVSFSDMCWCIEGGAANSLASLTVAGCTFANYDHGVAGIGTGQLTIDRNHFGTTANWDTSTDTYHHDGIHVYWGAGGGPHKLCEDHPQSLRWRLGYE